jgi:mitogen-activated protein kinase kinase kinase
MDMDQQMLKEMGIKKIGDRVRIGAQAKVFRNNVYKKASKKSINRVRNNQRLRICRLVLTIGSTL